MFLAMRHFIITFLMLTTLHMYTNTPERGTKRRDRVMTIWMLLHTHISY